MTISKRLLRGSTSYCSCFTHWRTRTLEHVHEFTTQDNRMISPDPDIMIRAESINHDVAHEKIPLLLLKTMKPKRISTVHSLPPTGNQPKLSSPQPQNSPVWEAREDTRDHEEPPMWQRNAPTLGNKEEGHCHVREYSREAREGVGDQDFSEVHVRRREKNASQRGEK